MLCVQPIALVGFLDRDWWLVPDCYIVVQASILLVAPILLVSRCPSELHLTEVAALVTELMDAVQVTFHRVVLGRNQPGTGEAECVWQ